MLHPRAFVVLRTSVIMNLFLVINSLTVANLPVTNGLAPRMDLEMIQTTPEMAIMTMTTMNLSTPQKS